MRERESEPGSTIVDRSRKTLIVKSFAALWKVFRMFDSVAPQSDFRLLT